MKIKSNLKAGKISFGMVLSVLLFECALADFGYEMEKK